MISVALARDLREAGLRWHPVPGDRFTIDGDEFGDEVFTISEMTIEAHDYSGTTVLGFNGTTEWALDSVEADDSLWLPREDQMRTLLGPSFRSLTRVGDGFTVAARDGDHTDADAENAYGKALLAYITASLSLDEPTPSP
ncbi:pilus assembly protein CpaE [Frondihabitans australicus]|uniref:Pilus assembly protein CpaE n=1 Tax=Frondihabitans australicus TaxID=386892 RepID=A0A495IK63_9MICO|nr:pilus assembly protein CpaE [Frondihabitans australicus]RKR76120.1 hypothetical protein C8E83_3285 [Frondihabitans australicus]